jgi:hypothetical protein
MNLKLVLAISAFAAMAAFRRNDANTLEVLIKQADDLAQELGPNT